MNRYFIAGLLAIGIVLICAAGLYYFTPYTSGQTANVTFANGPQDDVALRNYLQTQPGVDYVSISRRDNSMAILIVIVGRRCNPPAEVDIVAALNHCGYAKVVIHSPNPSGEPFR